MLALEYYRRGVCDCGFHELLTTDRNNHFTFESKVCPVCRGSARQARVQEHADDLADKSLGENPPPTSPRSGDGRRTFVKQMTPLEVAARTSRRTKSPVSQA